MDVLKAQLDRIKQQLAGLNATQRMLVGTLVALMCITVYYWGHYAGSPEMVPVLSTALTDTQATGLEATLTRGNITYVRNGDQILVPSDRRLDAIAMVSHDQLLPADTASTFNDIFKSVNAFDGDTSRDMHYVQYLQATLAGEFQRWPEISSATVLINDKQEWRVEDSIQPSASVILMTHDHQLSGPEFHKLVSAASTLVASAVSGLTPSRVSVAIDERTGHGMDSSTDGGGASGDDLIDAEQSEEDRWERKIRDHFVDILGLAITVNCDVENRSITERSLQYDPKKSMTKAVEEKEQTEDSKGGGSGGGEPGVGANTSASIPTGSTGGTETETTSSQTDTKSQTFAGQDEQSVITPAGKVTVKSASLRVPRSYFANLIRKPDGSEPDDAAILARAEQEKANIRDQVQKALSITADAISVEMYTDAVPTLPGVATASIPPSFATVTGHAKEIGVLALAVVSLFMMSSMVRKSTPAPVLVPSTPSEKSGPSMLGGDEYLAGEAGFGQAALDGMELDEETVRTQQMLEQVSTMVKENPDNAAALVKRWLNRG